MTENTELTTTQPAELASREAPREEAPRTWATPPVDVYEDDRGILVVADLPGVRAEDLQIELHEGNLKLAASRSLSGELGRAWGQDFRRVFQVGPRVDAEGIRAELKHGVLSIHLPKPASEQPRQIPVIVR